MTDETPEIQPAMTHAEWANYYRTVDVPDRWAHLPEGSAIAFTQEDVNRAQHQQAAVSFDRMSDGDPRKPTWEMVHRLREVVRMFSPPEHHYSPYADAVAPLDAVADLLESLLPPKETP